MHEGHPSKKLRLEISENRSSKNVPLQSAEISFSDNNGLWGEDLNVDDEIMQQIESQALSQCQETSNATRIRDFEYNRSRHVCDQNDDSILPNASNYQILLQDLQTKQGEVKNLRIEQDKIKKEHKKLLNSKDEVIELLKKQLSEKQSEIAFQKVEKLSQTCKSPKLIRLQPSVNNSFYERFHFTHSKTLVRDDKIFNFGGQINKGDILYKLLHSSFNLNIEFNLDETEKEKEFTLYLNCCVLQLCRFPSFEKSAATNLIKLLICRSRDVLQNFSNKLSVKKVGREDADKKTKVITLTRKVHDTHSVDRPYLLLSLAKWLPKEDGVAVRQTITMLAKLMQIEPMVMSMLIKSYNLSENSRCDCQCIERAGSRQFGEIATLNGHITERINQLNFLISGETDGLEKLVNCKKTELVFDILELFHEIIREISVRTKLHKYEGVFSSVLYFCSTLCDYGSDTVHEKYSKIFIDLIRKILFSSPGSEVIQYMVEFLSVSTHFNLSDSLCHRSAAETFTENFGNFSFTRDTCVLQVLCAHIEMANKSPYFVNKFTSWIVRMTTGSHYVKWMGNETNSKLCECLPTLVQITVRISLYCVEEMRNKDLSPNEKTLLKSSIKRCSYIFKKFRWHDIQFNLHIANRLAEFEMLLHYLSEFGDDEATKKFVCKEMEILEDDKKGRLKTEVNKELLIKSLFEFTPMIFNRYENL